jgi:Interferon-induced transmembrane protein
MSAQPPEPYNSREYIPNNMVWAILTTLFCCLPFGIVSIVYAAQVDGRRAAGDIEGARTAAEKARFWAIVSAVSVPVVLILWFILFGGLAVLGSVLGA